MNSDLARKIIQDLLAGGVREFCVCAGARNAPLVFQLEKTKGIRSFSFFEERSASFFALGRVRESSTPVAVVTTSGTAVAECLPAVIEAAYQGLPLLIVSADRPRRYRGSGAPQTIDQVGIFGGNVDCSWDLDSTDEEFDFSKWSLRGPSHLNVCFEEPRKGESLSELVAPSQIELRPAPTFKPPSPSPLKNPLVILGPLLDAEKPIVENFLNRHELMYVQEGPAALQVSKGSTRLLCPEKSIAWGFRQGMFDSVLRIGGVPTLRFWRDLEEKHAELPVLSVSSLEWTGLARPSQHRVGIENLTVISVQVNRSVEEWKKKDRNFFESLIQLLQQYPKSELAWVRRWAERTQSGHNYLGNSLPIRHWDLVSNDLNATQVWANRGANGIDGQISSFLGWTANEGPEAWALLGDLTALYDLAAPWITTQLQNRPRRIGVINNFGGQIFKGLFEHEGFLNLHQIQFQKWAQMWNWNYALLKEPEDFEQSFQNSCVLEIQPVALQTQQFTEAWRQI